jgi:ribonuclease-3
VRFTSPSDAYRSFNVELERLQQRIGYVFKDQDLLQAALSHDSLYENSRRFSQKRDAFERLEFLGDRVLGLVIAHALYQRYPKEHEGALAKRLAHLICRERCLEVAHALELLPCVHGMKSNLHGRSMVLAHAIESLVGAIYRDGGLDAAERVILQCWEPFFQTRGGPPKDYKSFLQEWAQKQGKPLPNYSIESTSGTEHAPTFCISVSVDGCKPFLGNGGNKRQAEQQAAMHFLQHHHLITNTR